MLYSTVLQNALPNWSSKRLQEIHNPVLNTCMFYATPGELSYSSPYLVMVVALSKFRETAEVCAQLLPRRSQPNGEFGVRNQPLMNVRWQRRISYGKL